VVVPDGVDDPTRPSGGNTYDRRVCLALAAAGWSVTVHEVVGAWPQAGPAGGQALAEVLTSVPDGSLVLVDGLVASTLPEVVVPAAHRLRLVVLMHMPVGLELDGETTSRERDVLGAVSSVITPSSWTRQWLLRSYHLDPARVHVAHPGVDATAPVGGSPDGGGLLCVGAVTPGKGQDLLLGALSRVADLPWRCTCVGALSLAADFVERLRHAAREHGLDGRIVLAGPRTGQELDSTYATADLLVLASRAETFGMVVTEALARGLPVVATEVGGVSEALGTVDDGARPGLLTPPGDVDALAGALRSWLSDHHLRETLRKAALERRATLTGWSETADRVGRVLTEAAA
jgi:glycosyltransferase involved in cell wall biosynthesis